MFLSTTLTSAIGIVAIFLLTQTVPAAGLGSYFLFEAILGLASIGANFGLNTAVEKRISEGHDKSRVLVTATTIKLATVMTVGALLLGFGRTIDAYIGEPWTVLLVVALASREFSRLTVRALRGEFRMELFAFLRFFRKLSWAVIGLAGIVALGLDNVSLVYAVIASQLLTMAIALASLRPRLVRPAWSIVSSLYEYARYNVLTLFGGYVYSWMDTALLGVFVAPGLVAAYEIAWRVTKLVPTILGSISETTFPQLSELQANEHLDRAGRVVSDTLVPSLVIAIPSFFGLLVLSRQALAVVFGEAYTVASIALVILMFSQVLWSAESIFKRGLHAIDRPDLPVRSMVVAFVLNATLNVTLIPVFELAGAAVATTVAFAVQTGMDYRYLRNLLPISLPLAETVWSAIAAVVMALVVFAASRMLLVSQILELVALIGLGVFTYFVVLLLNSSLRQDMRAFGADISPF